MNSQERVLYILQRIAQEPYSTQQLTQEIFGSDQRNKQRLIQMDIARLKQHFPHQITTLSQRHKLIKVPYFLQNLLSSDGIKIKELIEFLMVFDNKMLSLFEQEEPHLIQNLRKEIQEIYLIHEPPLEMIDGRFLESIKRAIKHRQYVNLDYQQPPHRLKTYAHIQLHRIIYAEGNWYLAIHQSKSLKPYNLLRINFIQSLELKAKTFYADPQIKHAIDHFQSLFSKPHQKPFEVIVQVSGEVMRHFQHKKHLRSQEILQTTPKGLIIRYQVTDAMEILPLIKKWMPHILVLSPIEIQTLLCRNAQDFLEHQQRIIHDQTTL